jgi:hypothetical protein
MVRKRDYEITRSSTSKVKSKDCNNLVAFNNILTLFYS